MRQFPTSNSARFAGAQLTKWLMVIFAITFFVDITGADGFGRLKPWLALSSGSLIEVWRWITYPLVDIQLGAWLFGMITLYAFGRMLEQELGSRRFAALLFISTLAGALIFSLMSSRPLPQMLILSGTTGLSFTIITMTALLYPNLMVRLLIPPVSLKLKTLAWGLLCISAIMMIAQEKNAAVSLSYLSGAGVAYLVSLKMSVLDLAKATTKKNSKTTFQAKARPQSNARQQSTQTRQQRAKKKVGMKARTKLNIRETEIDEILDKVSREGIGNLTDAEREILKFASKK